MSLRLRLAFLYGGLTGLIVLLSGILSYALHSRTQYDNVDRGLIGAVDHVTGLHGGEPLSPELTQMLATPILPNVGIRLYDTTGELLIASPNAVQAPAVNPLVLLNEPSSHTGDVLLSLLPSYSGVDTHHGTFALMTDAEGHRWRFFVVSINKGQQYFVADSSLREVDASVASLREVIPLLAVGGLAITLVIGALVAERALHPIILLTETARTIARSRLLNKRVPVGARRDELGELASTFNEMLANLEQAALTQQRFVADASHELRTPLTAIQANLELLARAQKLSPEAQQHAADEALREVYRLSRLVADLLALAHADAGATLHRHPIDLDVVVLETLRSIQPLTKGHKIVLEPFEVARVEGDGDRLKQLLFNLLDNALKYTPTGGRLRIGVQSNEKIVQLVVEDTGIGISAEELPNIFTRFYRADRVRSGNRAGTGLGLSIAQWIVTQHQGKIQIDSRPGQGTTVTVALPLAIPEGSASPSPAPATQPIRGSR